VGGSKISGTELPLEVHCTQDKTKINGVLKLTNTLTRISLLHSISMSKYMEEGTLYIGRSDLEGKMSEG